MSAISGRTLKATTDILKKPVNIPGSAVISQDSHTVLPQTRVQVQPRTAPTVEKPTEQRTIIIGKRKTLPIEQQSFDTEEQGVQEPVVHEEEFISPGTDTDAPEADSEVVKVSVKDPSYRAKDDIFGGKSIVRTAVPQARDSGLIHTSLAQKKSAPGNGDENEEKLQEETASGQSQTPGKKRDITTKKDDFSWI